MTSRRVVVWIAGRARLAGKLLSTLVSHCLQQSGVRIRGRFWRRIIIALIFIVTLIASPLLVIFSQRQTVFRQTALEDVPAPKLTPTCLGLLETGCHVTVEVGRRIVDLPRPSALPGSIQVPRTFPFDVRHGRVKVQQAVTDWRPHNASFSIMFLRVDNYCDVIDEVRFPVQAGEGAQGPNAATIQQMALWYLTSLPEDAPVIGVVYGISFSALLLAVGIHETRVNQTLEGVDAVSIFVSTHRDSVADYRVKILYKDTYDAYVEYMGLKTVVESNAAFSFNVENVAYATVAKRHPDVHLGGRWRPISTQSPGCNTAIIIPFRNRHAHLHVFLANIIPFLKEQGVHFQIYVIDQAVPQLFNRAALLNVGFQEAMRDARSDPFDCFIFHDVDLIPEKLANRYTCDWQHPRHLAVTRSITGYRLRYKAYFGGVVAMTREQIELINGFANRFFGWGGEDDDIYGRLMNTGLSLSRPMPEVGRYRSLEHEREERGNPHVYRNTTIIHERSRETMFKDGLNSLSYQLLRKNREQLYTHVYVQIPGPVSERELNETLKRDIIVDADRGNNKTLATPIL